MLPFNSPKQMNANHLGRYSAARWTIIGLLSNQVKEGAGGNKETTEEERGLSGKAGRKDNWEMMLSERKIAEKRRGKRR